LKLLPNINTATKIIIAFVFSIATPLVLHAETVVGFDITPEEFNQRFDIPLLPNELKHIIKSIAKFCKSSRFGVYSAKFKEKQREDGRIGGKASNSSNGGKARSEKYAEKRQKALEMYQEGVNKSEIARKLSVARLTVVRWLG